MGAIASTSNLEEYLANSSVQNCLTTGSVKFSTIILRYSLSESILMTPKRVLLGVSSKAKMAFLNTYSSRGPHESAQIFLNIPIRPEDTRCLSLIFTFPIAFNAIENVNIKERHLVSSGLIGIFKKIWADSWGPRLEYVLRNAILALLETPNSTLLGVMRILSDKEYRKMIVENLTDPVVKQFWTDEFAKYSSKFEVEAIAPIQNKVGQFLTNPMVRNIVGQKHSAFKMREIMDSKKILIMNLSKGRIGEDSSALLGAMLITKIQQAAMSRIDASEEDRPDFYLYVDEFQNFATESFAGILSEARKYRLDLILAHQYTTQLLEPVRDAVLGNAGTLMCFRIGADDAEFFEKEFSPEVAGLDLVNLPNRKIYLKLMIDGVTSRAFSADTLPPIPKPAVSYKDVIIENSRKKYGTSRQIVEDQITDWSASIETNKNSSASGSSAHAGSKDPSASKEPRYPAQCSECGIQTTVPFVPDPKRKIFCKDCLNKIKEGKLKPSQAPITKAVSLNEALGNPRTQRAEQSSHDGNAPQTFHGIKQAEKEISAPPRVRREPDLGSLRDIIQSSLVEAKEEAAMAKKQEKPADIHSIKPEDIQNF